MPLAWTSSRHPKSHVLSWKTLSSRENRREKTKKDIYVSKKKFSSVFICITMDKSRLFDRNNQANVCAYIYSIYAWLTNFWSLLVNARDRRLHRFRAFFSCTTRSIKLINILKPLYCRLYIAYSIFSLVT